MVLGTYIQKINLSQTSQTYYIIYHTSVIVHSTEHEPILLVLIDYNYTI